MAEAFWGYDVTRPGVIVAEVMSFVVFFGAFIVSPTAIIAASEGVGADGILGFGWYLQSPKTARYALAAMVWFLVFTLLWPLLLVMIFFRAVLRAVWRKTFGENRRQGTRQRAPANDVEMATWPAETALDLSRATTLVGGN